MSGDTGETAGGDGRRGADRLAHRLRLGARGALSGARGCLASGHGRRRRAGAASRPRASGGAADHAGDALEPHALARDLDRRSRCRPPASSRTSPTTSKRRCARPTSCPARRCRRAPLIRGAWLKKGAHVDLVGAFTPKMREADDAAMRRARVYVDTRAGAPKEVRRHRHPAEEEGHRAQGRSRAICSSSAAARRRAASARTRSRCSSRSALALEDLAAAMLVWNGQI